MQVARVRIAPAGLLALVLGLALLPAAARAADERSFWDKSQLQIGVGGTYHFWSATHAVVLPVSLVMDDNRFELGIFRMANAQRFYDPYLQGLRKTSDPDWGFSLSRRWQLAGSRRCKLYFGFGASYKTEENDLSATHWNFASQLGVRIALKPQRAFLELDIRHWSNAGIKLPNRGQDFATAMVGFTL